MGTEAVSSIPTARIGVPRSSDYQTPPAPTTGITGSPAAAPVANGMDNTLSSSGESDSDEDLDEGGGPSASPTNTRKRKRGACDGGSTSRSRMMCLFQGLMKQVVEKQEAMQQRFLETIEKTEQERMAREDAWRRQEMAMQQRFLETIEKTEQERTVREEAWKCQEMDRLNQEHEMMAQDREISASRHATVITLLQKISGQNIQFAYPAVIPAAPPLQPQSISPLAAPVPPPQPKQHRHHHIVQHQPQQQKPQSSKVLINHHRQPTSTDHVTIPVPEQQHSPAQDMGSAGFGSASSRWQDTEVLVLIQLIESRYREAGPKKGGPFWGEISTEMGRMGYSRSGKKCSEKWANINNIFRRHKETKDAKTWPYFHQLDALYRKKVHGGSNQDSPIYHNQSSYTSSSTVDPNTNDSAETNINNNSNCGGGSYIEGAASVAKKPEDFVKELIEQTQSNHHQQPQPMTMGTQPITMGFYSKMMGEDNDNIEDDEEMDDSDDDEDTTGKIEDKARITNRCWLNTASYFGSANEAASRIYLGFVGTSH